MKEIQSLLSFPVPSSRDRGSRVSSERRDEILGRPRRIKPIFNMTPEDWDKVYQKLNEGATPEEACAPFSFKPKIIKISIPPNLMADLKRVCKKLEGNSTIPGLVRIAVMRLAEAERNTDELREVPMLERRRRGRCKYPKILFSPEEFTSILQLKEKYKVSRQRVINMAILDYLKGVN